VAAFEAEDAGEKCVRATVRVRLVLIRCESVDPVAETVCTRLAPALVEQSKALLVFLTELRQHGLHRPEIGTRVSGVWSR
jgi:hypothetical protein